MNIQTNGRDRTVEIGNRRAKFSICSGTRYIEETLG